MAILGYNQKPGSNIWESIPTLELKDVVNTNNPKVSGEDDGANNIPNTDETELSKTESAIVCQAEEHLQVVQEFASKEKTDLHRMIGEHEISELEDEFEDIKNTPEAKFASYNAETKNELINLRVNERSAFSNLRHFKARNNLVRPANYPSSMKFHFGVLLVFLLGESLANMYFFAEGSSLGILGGFFQATLISLVNIAFSYIIGMYVLVQLNHCSTFRKTIGGTITFLYITIISIYHLLVAHYRDLLSINPDNATLLVWQRLIDAPFTFHTMESAMVLIIGTVIAILACNKGYRHDDIYPGYGEVSRDYEKRNDIFNEKLKEVTMKLNSIIRASENDLNHRMAEYEKRLKYIKDLYHGLESLSSHFASAKHTLDSVVDTSITIYRKSNQEVRITPSPKYFSSKVKIADTLSSDKDFFGLQKTNNLIKRSEERLLQLRKNAAVVSRFLGDKTKVIHEEIDAISGKVDKSADTIVKELLAKVSDANIQDATNVVLEQS